MKPFENSLSGRLTQNKNGNTHTHHCCRESYRSNKKNNFQGHSKGKFLKTTQTIMFPETEKSTLEKIIQVVLVIHILDRSLRKENKMSRLQNSHFQNFIVMPFPKRKKKNSIFTIFLSAPIPPSLKKHFVFFDCRLAVYDSKWRQKLSDK